MNNNYEEEVATGRLTPRQIRRGIPPKSAAYGKKNNGRTGYVDKTTANRLSTTNLTDEEIEKMEAAKLKEIRLNARRTRRQASLDRKSAPVFDVEAVDIPEADGEFDFVLDCEVLGPSSDYKDAYTK